MDEDLAILDRYDQGDEEAFTELVTRYQKPLYRTAYRIVGKAEDALDLVQQAFIRLFTHHRGFRREAKLKTWLYQILINLCLNHLRDSARRRPVDLDIEKLHLTDQKTALDTLVEEASRTEIRGMIDQLPDRQRVVLILRVFQELPFNEISRVLGCALGTAKANYHHGFKRLRVLLEETKK